jgi:hypothetical protein
MLFNLFGKKEDSNNNHTFSDRAYINAQGKKNGCLRLAKEHPEALFIAWFSETAKAYKVFFAENGMDESRIIDARQVHAAKLQDHLPVFLEHYPLHEKELELVANWEQKNIIVYNSLDEALFKHFGSDKMIPLIKMLGMKEDEAIEHSYVTQSITRGQQKIAELVELEQSASSQEEWMERNIKN